MPHHKATADMREPYLTIIGEQWDHILRLYKKFEDKKPIMLFDIQEQKIYAYPYKDFKAAMNKKSQISLKEQYESAVAENKMVVFVKDNENKKLRSYSLRY